MNNQTSIPVDAFGFENCKEVTPSKYAWPGGYPIFYIVGEKDKPHHGDIAEFCPSCVPANLGGEDEVIAAEINYEDAELFCDGCGKRIESAYAEDEVSE